MSVAAESLVQYCELTRRTDEKFSSIRAQYPAEFACAQGCHSCCKPGLTVNRMEQEALKVHLLARPELAEAARALAKANPHKGKRCSFLTALGACLVYEARPLVCRSHGAPLQMRPLEKSKDENLRVRDACPLNFKTTNLAEIPAEQVLNLDTLNTLLALLSKRAFPGEDGRTPLMVDALLK